MKKCTVTGTTISPQSSFLAGSGTIPFREAVTKFLNYLFKRKENQKKHDEQESTEKKKKNERALTIIIKTVKKTRVHCLKPSRKKNGKSQKIKGGQKCGT